jgi:hypothetical protein
MANVELLQANLLVLERQDGLDHGGLLGGKSVSGNPRNSWPV